MNGRMLNQLKEAIVKHKKGQALDLPSLPFPFGFQKLEVNSYGMEMPTSSSASKPSESAGDRTSKVISAQLAPSSSKEIPVLKSEQQNQLKLILSRQLQLKKAAMDAKNSGDMVKAKELLRKAKSLDEMVEAARCGLPVKVQDIPRGEAHQSLSVSQRVGETGKSATLERELMKQVKLCQQSMAQFQQLGDARSILFYETLLASTQSDLTTLQRVIMKTSVTPKFQLVDISLPILEVNADIPDDGLDLKIVKIEKLKLPEGWTPADCAIYVTYNFPLPHENHQIGRTGIIKGTDNPEFPEVLRLTSINRKTKQPLRILKRSPVKLEVYQKGSFLRSDKLWAHAEVLLAELENGATVEKKVDLLEGRRKTGGTILLQAKISKPLGDGKGTGTINRKWVKLI